MQVSEKLMITLRNNLLLFFLSSVWHFLFLYFELRRRLVVFSQKSNFSHSCQLPFFWTISFFYDPDLLSSLVKAYEVLLASARYFSKFLRLTVVDHRVDGFLQFFCLLPLFTEATSHVCFKVLGYMPSTEDVLRIVKHILNCTAECFFHIDDEYTHNTFRPDCLPHCLQSPLVRLAIYFLGNANWFLKIQCWNLIRTSEYGPFFMDLGSMQRVWTTFSNLSQGSENEPAAVEVSLGYWHEIFSRQSMNIMIVLFLSTDLSHHQDSTNILVYFFLKKFIRLCIKDWQRMNNDRKRDGEVATRSFKVSFRAGCKVYAKVWLLLNEGRFKSPSKKGAFLIAIRKK